MTTTTPHPSRLHPAPALTRNTPIRTPLTTAYLNQKDDDQDDS